MRQRCCIQAEFSCDKRQQAAGSLQTLAAAAWMLHGSLIRDGYLLLLIYRRKNMALKVFFGFFLK